ncbi:ABC transporter permease [Candidatus Formimonas warabiya]|uniref:D-ala-D-ala transporter subunit n=1 Tax=Formimonas warabiya TaxID=1761012 RepID=A0A3G1KZ41_FORW1|nr:ABC transporter permease [Candidatus Formimonas warabiya]ATW27650.1 D-ala-D-ala transporter subunit [Candidatus Formimonas warabiya]
MIIASKEIKTQIKEMRLSFYLLNRNILARIALIILGLLVVMAIFAPVLAPYPEDATGATHPEISLAPVSGAHWFGTDELGRDILSKIIYGVRISLFSAFITIFFAVLLGAFLGAIAGAKGGWLDELIMRVTDTFLSFPPLLLAIAIAALLGPSLINAQIAIVASWWPWYTRLMRGQAISVKEKQFVKAAEAIGTKQMTIVFRHIVPNCISPLVVQASMDMGGVILTIAALSFLGLGAQPPTPEWGLMVSTSKNYFLNAWWYSLFPGMAIFITVLSFNLIGDGLREVFDPKTRKN